jgi:hypothetical protein
MAFISYKMTHDSGFAPNPFHGYLTLATCKPGIRRSGNRRIGDWIAGFTSKTLCNDPVGQERLVYLMQVDEIIPLGAYFSDPRFEAKIPVIHGKIPIEIAGDNIYKALVDVPNHPHDFEQTPNLNHPQDCKEHDVGGRNALVAHCGHYFYFGRDALTVPEELRPDVPIRQSAFGKLTTDAKRIADFITFVTDRFDSSLTTFPVGMNGWPHHGYDGVDDWASRPLSKAPSDPSGGGPHRRAGCAR